GREWSRPLRSLARTVEFRRGLPDRAVATAADFLRRADELFRQTPVWEVELSVNSGDVDALARSPALGGLTALSLYSTVFGAVRFRDLLASPHIGRLRRLALRHNNFGEVPEAGLAIDPGLAGLSELVLDRCPVGVGDSLAELAASPWLGRLRRLHLAAERN